MLSSLRASRPLPQSKVEERFPQDEKGQYNQCFGKLLAHYEQLIQSIHAAAGSKITLPIGTELIENYLTGYTIRYFPFDKFAVGLKDVEGFWELDTYEDGVVNVFYNQNTVIYRQQFTKIHETIHFCQFLDSDFRKFVDDIVDHQILPREVVEKLLERITERAVALYLMPEKQFVQKFEETKNIAELAKEFSVSVKTAMYRLKECGILVPATEIPF